ncbi:uncharacterized protein KY384_006332 [Bacidia gigantensis]|uniref:uncharacterized protein n=1 Tax=Bacidia gigantensis TaxID=2732470 RepID=UPI001D059CF5|nr:uncharacterized protein KY384_006332 [Bacidia gigantensis]KAG8528645.1 hypothetical protein KY384_006332 [Bacidia gigantensis]
MESLNNTTWDIVLSGTGLPNSLLALALSRSGKKVLHHDEHEFYGGSEAALSLEEAEVWVERINHEATRSPFQQASITKLEEYVSAVPRLSFSRAYNLCLAPQIIYSRTNLLPALVASKVYKQLEFLAVGNWFIFDPGVNDSFSLGGSVQQNALEPASRPCLRRIPNGREGIVKDKTIDFANKRSLTQLLLMIKDDESRKQAIAENKTLPFTYFLTAQYQLDRRLQAPFHALTLSPNAPEDTTTEYALTRLHRHLSSMGAYGPGFCAVIPRWGGLAEIAQVGCRAGAVGGGVYVLNKGIGGFPDSTAPPNHPDQNDKFLALGLTLEETIYTRRAVGSKYDYPSATTRPDPNPEDPPKIAVRSIAIVTSSLPEMFPPAKAAVHNPAAVMVIFPTGSLSLPDTTISPSSDESPTSETPPTSDVPLPSPPPPAPRNPVPIYLQVRSAETGECPRDQSKLPLFLPSHNLALSNDDTIRILIYIA